MRRRQVVAAVVIAISCALATGAEAASDFDRSSNVRVMDSVRLSWRVSADYQGWPVYMGELAFQKRLIVASVQGDHTHTRPPGDLGEAGLATFRISRSGRRVHQLGTFECHGLGEITLWKNVVTQSSVRSTRAGVAEEKGCDRNGLRLLDVSRPAHPRVGGFVRMPCGALDHAIVPASRKAYVYVPSTCDDQAENIFNAGVTSEMSVVRIERDDLSRSRVVGIVDLFPLNGCSEIAVNLERHLAVCVGDTRFILLDISDPAAPRAIQGSLTLTPRGLTSPSFTWSGSRLVLGDETSFDPTTGGYSRVVVFDIEDLSRPATVVGEWIPPKRPGADHKVYSIVPVPTRDGRDVLAVANANHGFWLVDVTTPSDARVLAYYAPTEDEVAADPDDPQDALGASLVSAYWYNGYVYATDMDQIKVIRVAGFDRRAVHFFRGGLNGQTLVRDFLLE